MKKTLLLGLVFSFFLLSCSNQFDSSTQSEVSSGKDSSQTQQTQETYVEITNNSDFSVDLYSSPNRNADSLVYENIAPNSKKKIKITEEIDRVIYYVSFHIQIAEIDVPYNDDGCTVHVSIRKGEIAKGKVPNPVNIAMNDSWLILENKGSSGLSLFDGSTDKETENGKGTMLNTEESGVYKIDASNFSSYRIMKESNRTEIPFPESFDVEPGKIYKLVVDDSLKCCLEEVYSFSCTIHYITNDGTKQDDFTTIVGKTLTKEQLPELTKEGYVFGGWYINASFEGSQISFPYSVKSDITLYAKWDYEKYSITYNLNGGTNAAKNPSYYTIKNETLTLANPTKTGYDFAGWFTKEDFSGEAVTSISTATKKTVTIYAKWTPKIYKITYELGGGTNATTNPATFTIETDTITLAKPQKEGFVFDGWYTSEDFSGIKQTTIEKGTRADKKYYAKWLKSFTFDSSNIRSSEFYSNGILTVGSQYKVVTFKGSQSTIFSDLCIKVTNPNTKLVLDNFSFSSSRARPLIESDYDILIEYNGTNKLSSSSSSVDSMIKSSGTIEITGDSKSLLALQPNATTTTDCAIVKASKVIIDGGAINIKGSNGENGNSYENRGRNGSTGIEAYVVIKNNAIVTISGGNGGNGAQGIDGTPGIPGAARNTTWPIEDRKKGGDGGPGNPGKDGGNGGNGGHAIKGSLTVNDCSYIDLSGGDGGDGGKGGTGGTGGKGGDNHAWGGDTGNGGTGGAGGAGGNAGNGGDAISGLLKKQNATIYFHCGLAGKIGEGGIRGNPGEPGSVGTDLSGQCGNNGKWGKFGQPGVPGKPGSDGVEHR